MGAFQPVFSPRLPSTLLKCDPRFLTSTALQLGTPFIFTPLKKLSTFFDPPTGGSMILFQHKSEINILYGSQRWQEKGVKFKTFASNFNICFSYYQQCMYLFKCLTILRTLFLKILDQDVFIYLFIVLSLFVFFSVVAFTLFCLEQ